MPNAAELRELDDEELEGRLTEYRREMLNLRFQLATGQLDNVVRLSVVRKDVARVLTILRDREIALAEGRDAGPVPNPNPRPSRRRTVEEVDLEDEEVPARRPRASRAKTVDEGSDVVDDEVDVVDDEVDAVDDEDAAVAEIDADADEEDE
jgi:large subunit ribosomal protein L29